MRATDVPVLRTGMTFHGIGPYRNTALLGGRDLSGIPWLCGTAFSEHLRYSVDFVRIFTMSF
jgi:hypothetical protein